MKKLVTISIFGLLATSLASSGAFASLISGDTSWKPYLYVEKDSASGAMRAFWVKGAVHTSAGGQAPVVLVGDDQSLPPGVSSVTLDGSSSYSPSGATLTYLWEKISGPAVTFSDATAATILVSGLATGSDYTFKLTITDGNGKSASNSVDISVASLPVYAYYIDTAGSAKFNLTPKAQNITGWVDVIGQPATAVASATSANGITISTIKPDSTLWASDNTHGDSSAIEAGMKFHTPNDPFGYLFPDSVEWTGFVNAHSQYVPGTYNTKISGLDKDAMYQIQVLGSFYASSETVALYPYAFSIDVVCKNNGNEHQLVTTDWNMSRAAVFDTVYPDADGNIWLALNGLDSTVIRPYEAQKAIISGITVDKISRTVSSEKLTYLHKFYYDTVLMINDGIKNRPIIVYAPYNYNPAKKYSLIFYEAGDESTVTADRWNTQYMTQFGLSFVAEKLGGKMYGLDANGDTVSYVIIQPQLNLDSELYIYPDQVNSIVSQFRAKNLFNMNDSLYVAGFSSGGAMAADYLFTYPDSVKGVFIQPSIANAVNMHGNLQKVIDDSVRVWVSRREDGGGYNADTLIKYLPPSLIRVRRWNRTHNGFPQEYIPENRQYSPLFSQSVLDFFANPKPTPKHAFFALRVTTPANLPSYYTDVVGTTSVFSNPTQEVLTGTDDSTGWTLNTVAKTKWTWGSTTGLNYADNRVQWPYWMGYYNFNNAYVGNSKVTNFATNGADLQLTGLTPSHQYEIWVWSNGAAGNTTVWSTGDGTMEYVNGDYKSQNWKMITGTSDASGNLGIGMYGKTSSDIGVLCDIIVVEK